MKTMPNIEGRLRALRGAEAQGGRIKTVAAVASCVPFRPSLSHIQQLSERNAGTKLIDVSPLIRRNI